MRATAVPRLLSEEPRVFKPLSRGRTRKKGAGERAEDDGAHYMTSSSNDAP
jgi:hypothetical protein